MAKSRRWNTPLADELAYDDREDLDEFLTFFGGVYEHAKKHYGLKENEHLNLPNCMAACAWMAVSYKDHKMRRKYRENVVYLHNAFVRKYPGLEFYDDLMVKYGWEKNCELDIFDYLYSPLGKRLHDAGIRTLKDMMDMDSAVFRKIKGVGPKLVKRFIEAKELLAAHVDIAEKFRNDIEWMRKNYEYSYWNY